MPETYPNYTERDAIVYNELDKLNQKSEHLKAQSLPSPVFTILGIDAFRRGATIFGLSAGIAAITLGVSNHLGQRSIHPHKRLLF